MSIRLAKPADAPAIENLLQQLGYSGTGGFLAQKLERMLNDPDERVLVYETDGPRDESAAMQSEARGQASAQPETRSGAAAQPEVVALVSLHFIPQLALAGDFARISYFAVDDRFRSKGIGQEMEEYIVARARERHCDRIEVHCHWQRGDAHRFYFRQGYEEAPKYLIKRL
jgi:GNAT superfamily N-acetyltransferase